MKVKLVITLLLASCYTLLAQELKPYYDIEKRGWGYKNTKGKVKIRPKYDHTLSFKGGIGKVELDGKFGYVNTKGKIVIPIQYDLIEEFYQKAAIVKKGNLWGAVNYRGQILIPVQYKSIGDISTKEYKPSGKVIVTNERSYKAMFDLVTGKQLTSFKYVEMYAIFKQGLVAASKGLGRCGHLNTSGIEVIPFEYNSMNHFPDSGPIRLYKKGKKVYFNNKGAQVSKKEKDDKVSVYAIVEQAPTPKGGYTGFGIRYRRNLKYPPKAKAKKIEGYVFIDFIVEKNGSLSNIKLRKGLGYGCDEEAIRLVKKSSPWNPGKIRGVPVRVTRTIPISFKLKKDK